MPATQPTIRNYSLTSLKSAAVITRALDILRPHLPTSLPLYRRIQFGRFFDATCLLTNINCTGTLSQAEREPAHNDGGDMPPWVIAFVDRSCRPETEVWISGSWEASPPAPTGTDAWSAIDDLMLELVRTMKGLPLPNSIHQDIPNARAAPAQANGTAEADRDSVGLSRGDYTSHSSNPSIMLWGAVHENTVPTLQRLKLLAQEYNASLVPNYTFLFDIATLPSPRALPKGLEWGVVHPESFALIRSRTQIPRQDRTMAVLPSLAIFPSSSSSTASARAPVAWCFIGLEASLTTLHVEPKWRGRGLAKLITAKIFREKMGRFFDGGVEKKLGYGFVVVGNMASEGMCRSLGGRSEWECYWLRADLSKAS
ncbi:hypothetical protein LTR36_003041 [Oleoguttula mirabilis]|uniref:GCN5-related N-acetyltransferase Rv2170-like domain-containing protein n=1 Tax=Oleoguttula mirabilis TaxID=1507867 RepID=A0AAV9JWT6_9PEZI|nr:hypothetical protein LTR36_003041 [Oleoguttula mirabilis]